MTPPEFISNHRAMTAPARARARAPDPGRERPVGPALKLLTLAVCTAWTPKVVPVSTSPLMVVVMVAASGLAVVVLQPDQVPVHDDHGPQPAVQVLQAQSVPPQGPLLFQPIPGPPHGPPPFQPPGGPGRAVLQADTHEDQPEGPQPEGAPVMVGQAVPPDVAEKVASGTASVTASPALAHSWAMAS